MKHIFKTHQFFVRNNEITFIADLDERTVFLTVAHLDENAQHDDEIKDELVEYHTEYADLIADAIQTQFGINFTDKDEIIF